MKKILSLIFFIVCFFQLKAQENAHLNSLLDRIAVTENSRPILQQFCPEISTINAKGLVALIGFFNDKTITKVYSDCNNRYLTRGELAVIVADLRETMPYATVTGMQNCTLTFCENNPNLIEYYMVVIQRVGTEEFGKRYLQWLNSKGHKKWKMGSRCSATP